MATTYRYRVVPAYGKPKLLLLDEHPRRPSKYDRGGKGQAADGTRHDIYFNRGVAGSQAYARKLGNRSPTKTNPSQSR